MKKLQSASLRWQEIAYLCLVVSVTTLAVITAIVLVTEKYDALFPLPPYGQEHREYAQGDYVGVMSIGVDSVSNLLLNSSSEQNNFKPEGKPLQEFIKDKRDLNAQEGMWRAANYLVVLTFFQLALGGITLFLVFRTYRAQRDELEETRKVNELQLKPYLEYISAKLLSVPQSNIADFHPDVHLICKIQNIGKSVALNISAMNVKGGWIKTSDNKVYELDKKKACQCTESTVRNSLKINPNVSEESVRSLLPGRGVARKVLNPSACLEFLTVIPLKGGPGNWPLQEMITSYKIRVEVTFFDSFSDCRRLCIIHIANDIDARISFGDGTGAIISGNEPVGILIEK